MAFTWNRFAYTNFHELNLDWFNEHFKEIFEEWEELYNTLTQWKDDTDADLAQWKEDTLADMDTWERELLAALDEWKVDTGNDISDWESGVISDLNDWKETFLSAYESLEDRVEAIVSDTEDMVENLAEPFSSSTAYSTGDYVVYNGILYMFTSDHAAGAWTGTDAIQTTAINEIDDVKNSIKYTDNFIGNTLTTDNYVDDSAWTSGAYIDALTGILVPAERYSYQYVPLVCGGTYVTKRTYTHFGSKSSKITLHDFNHQYVKTVDATQYNQSTGIAIFTFSNDDILMAPYVGISTMDDSKVNLLRGNTYSENPVPKIWKVGMADHLNTKVYGGKLLCDGDSIAYGVRDFPDNKGAWFGRLKSFNAMEGTNYSVSGGCITYIDSSTHCISRNIDTIHTDNTTTDYLILEGGTNDADRIGRIVSGSTPANFGTWSETDFSGTYDDTKFCGAVESLFYKAITYFYKSKIGFIIPPEMGGSTVAALTIQNRRAYFDEIVKIASKWHIPVLDLWNISTMDARLSVFYDSSISNQANVDAGKYYYDGQHPTSVGYDFIQDKIQRWIESL